jgi:glycosyltransferase involved in cell wall biosynthesis
MGYIVPPFRARDPRKLYGHQNQWEAVEMARILNLCGFVVDVVQSGEVPSVQKGPYDLLISRGEFFERLSSATAPRSVRILLATGRHWTVHNPDLQARYEFLAARKGRVPAVRGLSPVHSAVDYADAIICVGNEDMRRVYEVFGKPVYPIDNSSFDFLRPPERKDYEQARRRFLWFGGNTLVLKGLDIVLDAFRELPDLELHVAGPVLADREFVDLYSQELFETPNIKLHDWVKIGSRRFRRLVERCGYMMYPSCSEGGAGCVVHCMRCGLVPIVTRETTVDVEPWGRLLEGENLVAAVRSAARDAARTDPDELERVSREMAEAACRRYTRGNFSKRFEAIVRSLTSDVGR